MTTVSKIFAVLSAILSLAFLGFVSASAIGGPNWLGEMNDETLAPLTFESSSSEKGTLWSVAWRRSPGDNVAAPIGPVDIEKNATSVPKVILKARQAVRTEQQKEVQALDARIQDLTARIQATKVLIEVDIKALERRETELVAELADLNKKVQDEEDKSIKKANETLATRARIQKRREEVFRLNGQLEDLSTDTFRLVDQQRKLVDQLAQVRGDIEKLERRRQQLILNGADPKYAE